MRKDDKGIKLPKGVTAESVAAINNMSIDELKAHVLTLQFANAVTEAFKETPEFLSAQEEFDEAKARYKYVADPIKDSITSFKNQTKLAIERLTELGASTLPGPTSV